MNEQIIEEKAIIKGLVQGVGLRATARHYAQKQGIKGQVRNLADGSVEIHAQGNKHAVDKFFNSILDHFGDYVQDIERTSVDLQSHDDFHINR